MADSLTKRQVLNELSFGERTAEAESDELTAYFVETDQWKKIYSGAPTSFTGPRVPENPRFTPCC